MKVVFVFLLWCWTVQSEPDRRSVRFSMVFSDGTHLLVDVTRETTNFLPLRNTTAGPSIQILTSKRSSEDPESPRLLVCLLKGLTSPWQQVLWWIDDTPVTSAGAKGPWMKSDWGYSATSVWEVSAAAWKSWSSYWCGTIQNGGVYRQRVCSED
ncbi:uncharacterized protein LOC114150795 isoform X1 [Xiphophorus couchianus]|uniref:uncharacterized protein LOC114150795 isoform X1 n=1 Tax=Xiphophorus couchianus TaxID=32473 RepID=UPI003F587EAB